ncbi:MAG TPA: nucleoside hydrolase [Candidatus Avilachnospira avistercoris]|nr:nucleoside hydrolase [Candidatus Avilachnospira avistercoris]
MGRRPFIIDCDTGTDDAIAIMAALYCDEVEVKAITSVNGNVAHQYTSKNNLDLMEYLGFMDIPVAKGAVHPIMANGYHAHGTHGSTGLGTISLPEAKDKKFDKRIASELIYETAVEEQGELELLVVGPMTNIAISLLQHPELTGLIKHIWFMGGSAIGGNVTPTAEFNIWIDPMAAHIVTQSGIPQTMVGLDVTTAAAMKECHSAELRTCGTKASVLCADLLDYMFIRRDKGGEDALMHDAMAFAAAVYPECLELKDCYIDVECFGEYTKGHTYVDKKGKSKKEPNASVALKVDEEKFCRWLTDAIKKSAG